MLDGGVEGAGVFRDGLRPPTFLCEAHSMLASDGSLVSNHPAEQIVEALFRTVFGPRLLVIHHDVRVNIAVAGVTETGDL